MIKLASQISDKIYSVNAIGQGHLGDSVNGTGITGEPTGKKK